MSAADTFSAAELQQPRRHAAIVHHIPGCIRVRIGAVFRQSSVGIDRARLLGQPAAMEGIQEVRINPGVRSVVTHYDRHRIAPEDWEALVRGEDTQVRVLFDRWLSGGSRVERNNRN